jgi:hypothetical protein
MCLKQSSIIKHFCESELNTSITVLLPVLAAVPRHDLRDRETTEELNFN